LRNPRKLKRNETTLKNLFMVNIIIFDGIIQRINVKTKKKKERTQRDHDSYMINKSRLGFMFLHAQEKSSSEGRRATSAFSETEYFLNTAISLLSEAESLNFISIFACSLKTTRPNQFSHDS